MRIQRRFILATVVPLCFVIILFCSIYEITNVTQSMGEAARHASVLLEWTRLLQSRLAETESAMQTYVVTNDRASFEEYGRTLDATRVAEARLQETAVGPDEKARVEQLVALVERAIRYLQAYRTVAHDQTLQQVRIQFEALAAAERASADRDNVARLRYRKLFMDVLNVGFVLAIGLSLGNALLFSRSLRKALQERDAVLRRYGLIERFARDVVKFVDRESARIIDANDAATRAYGYSKAELCALSAPDLRIPDERGAVLKHFNEAQTGVRGALFQSVALRKDGTTFPIEVSAGAALLEGRHVIVEIVRDITDRERAREELRLANDELSVRNKQLEDLNKELESFSYSISHDLRAPLRAIMGYARIIEEDHAERFGDEGRRLLGIVESEAARMGNLIDDLLKFSRLGRLALSAAPVDMESIVQEVLQSQTAAEPNNAFNITIGDLPRAYGDRTQLRQVWENLISNAIKYSRMGPKPEIHIRGSVQNQQIIYQVEDNGVGFDMQYADKLFGVFQRMHREDQFPGTGVGLAIVHRVISRHGGLVWADARPGAGATFSFTLPREVEHARL